MTDDHKCSKEVTLNTICLRLEETMTIVKEMRDEQKLLIETVQNAAVERAKYPTPETVTSYIKKVDRHDLYFLIGCGVVTIIVIPLLVAYISTH